MSAFTDAPWGYVPCGKPGTAARVVAPPLDDDPARSMGLAIVGRQGQNVDEITANARLMAAAPELLAVCEELVGSAAYWGEYDVPLGIVARLNAAIAKARGS